MISFIDYEDAVPVLTEYSPDESLRILLSKHDEFDEKVVELNVLAAKQSLGSIEDTNLLYACYVTAVAQTRFIADYYSEHPEEINF